jgi:hypothetical protein
MGNETKPISRHAPRSREMRASSSRPRLMRDPVVLGGAGHLYQQRRILTHLIDPGHDPFIFFGRHRHLRYASPRRYEHEDIPSHGAQLHHQIVDTGQIVLIMTGYRGIDLKREPALPGIFQGLKRFLKASFRLAKVVVDFSSGAIQAHGYALDA